VGCTIDNAFNLRDLVLQEVVKIIMLYHIKNLGLKFKCDNLYIRHQKVLKSINKQTVKLKGWFMGVHS